MLNTGANVIMFWFMLCRRDAELSFFLSLCDFLIGLLALEADANLKRDATSEES